MRIKIEKESIQRLLKLRRQHRLLKKKRYDASLGLGTRIWAGNEMNRIEMLIAKEVLSWGGKENG